MSEKERHLYYLRKSMEVSKQAGAAGGKTNGALLVDPSGAIVLEYESVASDEGSCAVHAETALMMNASKRFSRQELRAFTLYSYVEPCAVCAGAIYWGNIGTVVYGVHRKRLLELAGNEGLKAALGLSCEDVFACGGKPIAVIGPFKEIEAETAAAFARCGT